MVKKCKLLQSKQLSDVRNTKQIEQQKLNDRHNLSESPESIRSYDSDEKTMRICDINKIYDDKFGEKSEDSGLKVAVKYRKLGFENENLELKEELT